MGRLFGTDGVRGIANQELSPELAFKLGRVVGGIFAKDAQRAKMVLGKDTRISSDMLEAAIMAGMASVGVDVVKLGVVPTPGVAFLTSRLSADAGVMISASHNPVEYNGIKFFSSDGYKLSDELEDQIEEMVLSEEDDLPRPVKDGVGTIKELPETQDLYLEHLKASSVDLTGLRVVADCANGAAYMLAPRILKELGAQVIIINNRPDGLNVNLGCGSIHPNVLKEAVLEHRADAGLAYDGDADRLIAVDEKGNILNGDKIMAICGLDMAERDELPRKSIVATAYSNLGLSQLFKSIGGQVLIAENGDRYVLEKMRQEDIALGGEQSGHIIFLKYATTGDGILTSLQLLSSMMRKGRPLSNLADQMREFPQILVNVKVPDKKKVMDNPRVLRHIEEAKGALEGRGRLHIRPSGTEPLVRIMGEGPDREEIEALVYELAQVIREES